MKKALIKKACVDDILSALMQRGANIRYEYESKEVEGLSLLEIKIMHSDCIKHK